MQVGVYYASNALGRLIGTLMSGVLYTYVGSTIVEGFGACVLASCGVSLTSAAIDVILQEDQEGASIWRPFNRCLPCLISPPIYKEEDEDVEGGLKIKEASPQSLSKNSGEQSREDPLGMEEAKDSELSKT